jgi:hypothetical protein
MAYQSVAGSVNLSIEFGGERFLGFDEEFEDTLFLRCAASRNGCLQLQAFNHESACFRAYYFQAVAFFY